MITLQENATHLVVTGKPRELDILDECFRFRPEGYFFAVSYQRFKVSEGEEGWDGYIHPLFLINEGMGRILRGHKHELLQHCKMEGIKVDTSGLLEYPFADLEIDDVPPDIIKGDHELDLNQRQCILDWLRVGIGFNKVTVGGGKTATFAGAAAMIKQKYPDARFLYITPSERLVRQTTKEMKKFLPKFVIGQCGGGHREFGARDMVVCTVAMLTKHYQKLKDGEWFDTFMAILYDEVHHAGSKTSRQILLSIPAYFRLGASDTEKEKDQKRNTDIRGLFGPLLNEITSAPLIDIGRLAKPHIYVVDNPSWVGRFNALPYRASPYTPAYALIDGEWTKGRYVGPVYELKEDGTPKTRTVKTAEKDDEGEWITIQEPIIIQGVHTIEIGGIEHEIESKWCLLERMYDRAIIQFKPRNELIVTWAKHFHEQGWPTVVVATRTSYVLILEALLSAAIGTDHVDILVGKDCPSKRDNVFDWFKETPGSVLITPLVKEGVSINEIRAMVVADHVSDYEVARQIIGRAMRPKKKGDNRAHVVWFWDKQHITMRRGSANVLTSLERTDGFTYYHPCLGPDSVFKQHIQQELPIHERSPIRRRSR